MARPVPFSQGQSRTVRPSIWISVTNRQWPVQSCEVASER